MKYLMFVGSGRTGSTIVGHALNCHPNIFVSREMRALKYAVENNVKVVNLLQEMVSRAISDQAHPFANMTKKAKETWQKDWIVSGTPTDNKKAGSLTIVAIGDKKQGGNTKVLNEYPDRAARALEGLDVHYVTCIRRPDQVMRSYINVGKSPDQAAREMTKDMMSGVHHTIDNNGSIVLYESLLRDPARELKKILDRLEIEVNETDLELMASQVNTEKPSGIPLDRQALEWIESKESGFLSRIENLVSSRRPDIRGVWKNDTQ